MQKSIKKAFFRFEASPQIGAGHAIRSCVLADELIEHGWDCQIVTSTTTYDFLTQLTRFKRIEPDGFYANPTFCDLYVIDHYDLDISYETRFRSFAQKILVIDDLANRKHECDILLNQNNGYRACEYASLVPSNCELLLGLQYCLVEKKFYKNKKPSSYFVKKILFYFGGGTSYFVLNKINRIAHDLSLKYDVGIITGFQTETDECFNKFKNFGHVFNAREILKAYQWCDVSVGFAGQGMFERYVMGIPCLVFSQNNLQASVLGRINLHNILYGGNISEISVEVIQKYFLFFQKKNSIDFVYLNNSWIQRLCT